MRHNTRDLRSSCLGFSVGIIDWHVTAVWIEYSLLFGV